MTCICIVTDELYPFTGGGIGRVVHNLIRDSLQRSDDARFELMIPAYVAIELDRVETYFGARVRVRFAAAAEGWTCPVDESGVYPPRAAFTDSEWHAQSLDLMRALKKLEKEVHLDFIEFPDYRGWAFATLQEKLLGRAFTGTGIAVRIHSTDGVLQAFEQREPSWEQVARFDLERKALYDADHVIAHLAPVAEFNARYYGFGDDWKRKVIVQFPPVLEGAPPSPAVPAKAAGDLLFITKRQPFKRPDVFIRGAATFLRAHPEFKGRAIAACHSSDERYARRLKAMVPADLRSRFRFLPAGPERETLLPGAIVVIPSAYESLNLTAFEVAAAGAQLVLNGGCVAFGEGTPWKDGVNCHKFDGSVEGLAETLSRAAVAPPPEAVQWKADAPYWLTPASRAARKPSAAAANPLVSIIIPNFNLARWLPETLASLADSTYEDLEIVVVDDASTEPLDAQVLERLEADGSVRVVRNAVNRGLSGSRNIGIRASTGKYILPLDADDCIAPGFIQLAVEALEAHPGYSVVVPTAGYFDSDADLAERNFADFAIFLGDAPSLGLVANRMSCATALVRRSLYDELQYDESLDSYEDWSLWLRAVQSGHRFLVTNHVQFHYRRRPGSMISGMNPERHLRLLERMFSTLPATLPSVRLFALLAPLLAELRAKTTLEEELARLGVTVGPPPPVRHSLADRANAAVKKLPIVHPFLRAAARKLNGGESNRPLRHELTDKLNATLKRLPLLHPLLKATGKGLAGAPQKKT